MRNNFDYPHTCPKIDKNISNFDSDLSAHLNTLVEELNPMFYSSNESWKFVEGWKDTIYSSAEPCFENTRQANSDMRDSAEKVITDLIEERDHYMKLAEDWEYEAETKDKEIADLKAQLEDKDGYINDLKTTLNDYEL